MRLLFYWLLASLIVISSCASSSKNEESRQSYENLITLQQPDGQPNKPAQIYIDSVKSITRDQKRALLIQGTFPDACTNLEEITHRIKNDSLFIDMKAWRNPETMCAQVLTSFSYIYRELDEDELTSHSEVIINDTAYNY